MISISTKRGRISSATEYIAHIQTEVFSLAIDRQRFTVTNVVDEERYQLSRELIGTVVVGTIRYDSRHAVCIVVSTHKMVA